MDKKGLLTKTYKCYKTSKFLWKNEQLKVYFDMKQTSAEFSSKKVEYYGFIQNPAEHF